MPVLNTAPSTAPMKPKALGSSANASPITAIVVTIGTAMKATNLRTRRYSGNTSWLTRARGCST